MDAIAVKTRLGRLQYMFREKGLKYTWNYLFMASTYNNDFIRYLLLTKLYRWFVFYPRYFEVEVTTRCNLKCIMCEHTYWKERSQDLSLAEFMRIIDQFPKLKWIGTTGIGSSFLNKDFPGMLQYVKSRNENIYVELFDSFTALGSDTIQQVVEQGLIDRWIASVDGATRETYEKIRVGADFDTVKSNVKQLIETKERHGTNFPELSFHFVISKENYREVPQFVELVASLSRGRNIGILFSHLLHDFSEIDNLVFEIPHDLKLEAERIARENDIKLNWGKNIRERQSINRCTEWSMPFIFADGSVVQCCASNEANRRQFQIDHRMGNVLQTGFESVWHGNRFRSLRNMIHKGMVPEPCNACTIYHKGTG